MYNGITYLNGIVNNDLYEIKLIDDHTDNKTKLAREYKNKNSIELWVKRLGHRNYNSLKELKEFDSRIEIDMCRHKNVCEKCIKCKFTDSPYPKKTEHRANKVLQLILSNICSPFKMPTMGGKTYFLTFIDDYSRFVYVYL